MLIVRTVNDNTVELLNEYKGSQHEFTIEVTRV